MNTPATALREALRSRPICLRCGAELNEAQLMRPGAIGLCHPCGRGIRVARNRPSPAVTLRRLWEAARGICALCEWPCALEDATRDHVVPLAHRPRRHRLQLAHRWCNHAKGSGAEAPPYQDAWLKVARAIVFWEGKTWFEPIPEAISREARRLVDRGFRTKRRVPGAGGARQVIVLSKKVQRAPEPGSREAQTREITDPLRDAGHSTLPLGTR
jgi:5-methylcytosine-specific restriction endonuclease McrA